ncbi:hypothetical protein PQ465_09115 [Sphingobacterium oryzagri]|uniref:Uncharacterized protein n=1 Tax=Sphingobacterium oryzagri TaxID=3025669 RepID=A0ABY7WLP5_9SPHI|nr:hypothetical protein [Sphingobacterium sp. KACC 22765]WDF70517.1 hypothetical protein PQ465_09115 [Sphingobacterium sp. KACC 22765]
MKKVNIHTFALLVALATVSCGQTKQSDTTAAAQEDSTVNQQQNNSGTPLDNLHRDNSSDTLKEDVDVNTGVPLNNLTREQVRDSLATSTTAAPE